MLHRKLLGLVILGQPFANLISMRFVANAVSNLLWERTGTDKREMMRAFFTLAALVLALAIWLGFTVIPLAVYAGVVR